MTEKSEGSTLTELMQKPVALVILGLMMGGGIGSGITNYTSGIEVTRAITKVDNLSADVKRLNATVKDFSAALINIQSKQGMIDRVDKRQDKLELRVDTLRNNTQDRYTRKEHDVYADSIERRISALDERLRLHEKLQGHPSTMHRLTELEKSVDKLQEKQK